MFRCSRLFLSVLLASLGLARTSWSADATAIPPGGQERLATPELRVYAGKGEATVRAVTVEGQDFAGAQRLVIPQTLEHPWDAGARAPLTGAFAEGDAGLLVLNVRALPLPDQAGASAIAEVTAYVEESAAPYGKAATMAVRIGPEWRAVFLPFKAEKTLAEGAAALVLHLGARAQALEVGPARLLHYGPAMALRDLPRTGTTYAGREPDAPWRAAALDRIERLRTAPLRVQVVDAAGQPVPGAEVRVELVHQAFGFGSAVRVDRLTGQDADSARYREIVRTCFSRVVFENDLKMEFWERSLEESPDSGFRWSRTRQAAGWLRTEGIPVRGHYLLWAPWEPWSEKLRDQPDQIRSRVLAHIPRITAETGDMVSDWDAINHLAGWDKNIDESTGVDFYTDVMRACRAATQLPLWVNEDQVFRPGRQQEDYYQRIRRLIDAGVPPDGIGNQAHFDSSFLPSPEEMWAVNERFAALVPALQITEFDVTTNGDEALEADYLRDALILSYSHPAFTAFLTWGFWEGCHWKPQTALWRQDWSEKPAAAVWREWVAGQWKTKAAGRTGGAGEFVSRGHFGRYTLTASHAGKRVLGTATLTRDGATVTLTLPER